MARNDTITILRGEGDPPDLTYGELAYDSLGHKLFVGLPDNTPFVLADHYSYVPYTGAWQSMNLGSYGVLSTGTSLLTTIKADHIGEKTAAHMVTFDNTMLVPVMYCADYYNSGSSNYGRINGNQGTTYGFQISRNMADAVPIVRFKQLHASGTGNYWECRDYAGVSVSSITSAGVFSANVVTADNFKHLTQTITVNADAIGNTNRSLLPLMIDAYSDQFLFKPITALEYWDFNTGAWVAETAADAQPLLDGAEGTVFQRTPDKRKWRVTIDANTYLMAGLLVIGQEWVYQWGSSDLIVTVENSSDLTNWTTVSTFSLTRYSSNSRKVLHELTDHSTRNYWRLTFEATSLTYNSAFNELRMLASGNFSRGYYKGLPMTLAYDKSATFAGVVAATGFKAGAATGIDATISYRKSDGVTNGTLTFTKGLLTAQT